MFNIGLILFGIYLLVLFILDTGMLISLVKQGDERGQLVVWKASTLTLLGTMGSLVIEITKNIITNQPVSVNPFITLSATATIYFLALLYYRKKHGY